MKRIFIATVALSWIVISSATLSGCKDKKEEPKDSTAKVANIESAAEIEDNNQTDTFASGGHTFNITVHRYSNTSAGEFKDEFGDKFYDNVVDIRATRDGQEIFNKHFSKADFRSHINADTTRYILQGIGFNKKQSDANNLTFSVELGEPGSDDGTHFLLLTISPTGAIDIREDLKPDTSADDGGIEMKKPVSNEPNPDDNDDEQI